MDVGLEGAGWFQDPTGGSSEREGEAMLLGKGRKWQKLTFSHQSGAEKSCSKLMESLGNFWGRGSHSESRI